MGTEQVRSKMQIDMIAYLRQFILDSYSTGFAILQELVQNANDANSRNLVIELVRDGIKDANNPLLRKPFVLVSNDGPFTEKDEKAIYNIGVGSKRGDTKTIGKYGLGMKSLFHWADVLIFFNKDKFGILNPFALDESGESEHSTWHGDEVKKAQDIDRLKNIVRKSFKKDDYFSLFIPLRQNDSTEHIENSYYPADSIIDLFSIKADNSSTKEDFINAFSEVLTTIHYTSLMDRKLERISLLSDDENIEASMKRDSIEILDISADESIVVNCHGYSCSRNIDGERALLKTSSSWPTIKVDTPDSTGNYYADSLFALGSSFIVLKKLEPNDKKRRLKIMWASYLPLKDEEQIKDFPIEGKYAYTVIINSSFCTDSGRNRINGFDDIWDPEVKEITPSTVKDIKYVPQMESIWNSLILHKILIPDFTEMIFELRKALGIRSKDDFNALLKACRMQSFDRSEFSTLYTASTNHKVILYQDNEDHTLDWRVSVPEENTFTSPVPSDRLLINPAFLRLMDFIKASGPLCFESPERVSFRSPSIAKRCQRDESYLNELFKELCSAEYESLYMVNDFFIYLAELIVRHPNAEYKKPLMTLIRKMMVVYMKLDKVAPIAFREEFLKAAYDYCTDDNRGTEAYFIKVNNRDAFILKCNSIEDTNFIVLPETWKYKFKGEVNFYPDTDAYVVACLNEILVELSESIIPYAFEELILKTVSCLPDASLKLLMPKWINTYFQNLPVIPIECYTKGKSETVYRSYRSLDMLYKAPGVQYNTALNLLYTFIPDFPPLECVIDKVYTLYGLNEIKRVPFSLIDILETAYRRDLDMHPIWEEAEAFLVELIGNNGNIAERIVSNYLPVFPTTDHVLACLSTYGTKVFIDLNGCLKNFQPKNDSFHIVNPKNDELKAIFRTYAVFSEYIISREKAIDFYLEEQNPESYDSREMLNLLKHAAPVYIQNSLLKDCAWFEYAGRKYAPSHILMPGLLSNAAEIAFDEECLILSDSELLNPDIELLKSKGLLIESIDQISFTLIQKVFSNCAILPLANCNKDILETLVSAMSSLSSVCPLSGWGSFLRDYRNAVGNIPMQLINWNGELGQHEYFTQWGDVLLKLGEWSKDFNRNANSLNANAFQYVMSKLNYDNLAEVLKALKGKELLFPSQGSKWSLIDDLCDSEHFSNIDPNHLLMSGIVVSKNNANVIDVGEEKSSGDTSLADAYKAATFSDLKSVWPTANIALIAMLLYVCRAFDQYPTCIDAVNGEQILQDKLKGYRCLPGHSHEFLGLSKEEIFSSRKSSVRIPQVILTLNSKDKFPAFSITGKKLEVDVRLNAKSGKIFVSDKAPFTIPFKKYYFILPAEHLKAREINELIVNLIQTILERVFSQVIYSNGVSSPIDFRPALRELATSSQQDRLKVTQDQIMRALQYTLRTLKVDSKDPAAREVRDILRENDNMENDLSHCRTTDGDYNEIRRITKCIEDNQKKIINMLIAKDSKGSQLRDYILNQIRGKLGNNQYSEGSVLFEFFQNADDACLQLKTADRKMANKKFYFVVDHDDRQLRIRHNGRNINLNPYESNHPEWRLDLMNMLRFNISNKNEDQAMIETGTYGLGFKSCYFITDEPHIYSGIAISTKISGGIYPEDDVCPDGVDNEDTLFVLPYRKDKNKESIEKDVITPFERNIAGIMLFSKCINEFIVDGKRLTNEDVVEVSSNIHIHTIDGARYLKISLGKGDVVFALGSNGITKLKGVSPFWKTQPLQKLKGPSYMINSDDFKVDTGRNTLRDDNANTDILKSLGEDLGKIMASLLKDKVEVLPGLSGCVICSQILDLISDGINDVDRTMAETFYRNCYEKFISITGRFYTGFNNVFLPVSVDYRRCCTLNTGLYLSSDMNELITEIGHLIDGVCKGQVIVLRRKCFIPKSFEELDYSEISTLMKLYEACGIDDVLGVEQVESVKCFGNYLKAHNGVFSWNDFRFKNINGNPQSLDRLVDKHDTDISAVAPQEFRLNHSYPDYINGRLVPDDYTLARWIDHVKTKETREAAARLVGRNFDIVDNLSPDGWFLRDHDEYIKHIPSNKRDYVKKVISDRKDKVNHLEKIYQIWDRLSQSERTRYIENLRVKQFGKTTLDLSNPNNDDWLRLLCTAASQSIGRTTDEAIIKFIDYFLGKYRSLGKPGSKEDSRKWMDFMIFKEMSYTDGKYEHWRKWLPVFAQLVMCKNDLYELWVKGTNFDPKQILKANGYEELDEYDYELPDLSKALEKYLGIVMRELLASGIDIEDREALLQRSIYLATRIKDKFNLNVEWEEGYDYLVNQGVDFDLIAKHYDYPLWCDYDYVL